MTRARDALNVKRRELPMVRVEKDYVLRGARREGHACSTSSTAGAS